MKSKDRPPEVDPRPDVHGGATPKTTHRGASPRPKSGYTGEHGSSLPDTSEDTTEETVERKDRS